MLVIVSCMSCFTDDPLLPMSLPMSWLGTRIFSSSSPVVVVLMRGVASGWIRCWALPAAAMWPAGADEEWGTGWLIMFALFEVVFITTVPEN